MQQPALARAVPIAVGVVIVIAGTLQFSKWKARNLACCRELPGSAVLGAQASSPATFQTQAHTRSGRRGRLRSQHSQRGRTLRANPGTAWRHGLRLGLHCSYCCSGLMAILLVAGVMDLLAMAIMTVAITVERLAPAGERVARAIGVVIVGAGLFLISQAAGLGLNMK